MIKRPFLDSPTYYSRSVGRMEFYGNIRELRSVRNISLNKDGLCQLMLFGGNFYPYSLFNEVVPVVYEPGDKKGKFCDEEQAMKAIRSSVESPSKEINEDCYLMFSGGMDSSIVFSLCEDHIKEVGCSLYRKDYYQDVVSGLKYFPDKEIFNLESDRGIFFGILNSVDFVHPFINEGIVDDTIHSLKAKHDGIPMLLTGMGADEFFGDYSICRKHVSVPELDEFLNRYSIISEDVIFDLFDYEKVKEVYYKSTERFDFSSLEGRIQFVLETVHFPNQCALSDNTRVLTGQKRFSPFNTERFWSMTNKMKNDMIENNGISKYILRKAFSDKVPRELILKPSKDFEVDPELLYDDRIREAILDLILKNRKIVRFDGAIIEKLSKRQQIRFLILLRQLECFFIK